MFHSHPSIPSIADACRDGTFFVADGYCNSRVVKFSKDGKYLGEAAFKDGQVGREQEGGKDGQVGQECQTLCMAA